MGLFKFYWTDAIANAGGTTIKYVDTKTAQLITVSNVLGAIVTDNTGFAVGPVLFRNGNYVVFYALTTAGVVNVNTTVNIRVFYF